MAEVHQRQIIRKAVVEALLNQTSAQDRVFPTRVIPLRRIELPAVSVYALEEEVDPESRWTAPRELKRSLRLLIEAVVEVDEHVDDALDAIALEIERAMSRDETFGGAASDSILESTDLDIAQLNDSGKTPIGTARLVYDVIYYTYAPDPADGALDEFERANIRHSVGGAVAPGDEAIDDVEVRED